MKKIRCAVYCRKSSEEGLEQEFNSLNAQREACEAYIASQKHEGWELIPQSYNDGGFSGGNMERPALKQLFEDIKAGLVNVIIVYKIDRLSRSIADFMRMIEVFDRHTVDFVSVTQSFNTQNSMGKLMLNILLSFAQFEREVTGERIRDKIAASKKKGMWMGGTIPLGYDLIDRKLLVNDEEAKVIKHIFERYLELKSVNALKLELDNDGYQTKSRKNIPKSFSKGHLYHMLQNRLYLGEVNHKDKSYQGEHHPIIDPNLYEKVQDCLKNNRINRSNAVGTKSPCLLAGKLFDDKGNYMTPKHSRTRKRHYRYYTSQAIINGEYMSAGSLKNIPAHEIECFVKQRITELLKDREFIQGQVSYLKAVADQRDAITRAGQIADELQQSNEIALALIKSLLVKAIISNEEVELHICLANLVKIIQSSVQISFYINSDLESYIIKQKIKLSATTNGSKVITGSISPGCNQTLVKAIARSFLWHEQIITGERQSQREIMRAEGIKSPRYIERIMNLRFLPPKIIENILLGNQPDDWTLNKVFSINTCAGD